MFSIPRDIRVWRMSRVGFAVSDVTVFFVLSLRY